MRTTTQIFGTVASAIAAIIFAPCLMMPCRSTAVPTMKPGTSARNSSGIPNASQVWMNRAALSAESTNSTPPRRRHGISPALLARGDDHPEPPAALGAPLRCPP